MALNTELTIVARNAALASGLSPQFNGGKLQLCTGSQPADVESPGATTVLAVLTLNATAFGAPSAGVVTANAITGETNAPATGTAGHARLYKSDGTTLLATGTVGTVDANVVLGTTAVNAGNIVNCTSLSLTVPKVGA